MQPEAKTAQFGSHSNFKRNNFEFALYLNGNSPFSGLALYKHFGITDANRSPNDAVSKYAAQIETKMTQLRNHRNLKKTAL